MFWKNRDRHGIGWALQLHVGFSVVVRTLVHAEAAVWQWWECPSEKRTVYSVWWLPVWIILTTLYGHMGLGGVTVCILTATSSIDRAAEVGTLWRKSTMRWHEYYIESPVPNRWCPPVTCYFYRSDRVNLQKVNYLYSYSSALTGWTK